MDPAGSGAFGLNDFVSWLMSIGALEEAEQAEEAAAVSEEV